MSHCLRRATVVKERERELKDEIVRLRKIGDEKDARDTGEKDEVIS